MKKILIVCMVLVLIVPSALTAGNELSIGLGGLVMTQQLSLGEILENPEFLLEYLRPEILKSPAVFYGGEARYNMGLFQVSGELLMQNTQGYMQPVIYGIVNGGLYLNLGIAGLGLTGGPVIIMNHGTYAGDFYNARLLADIKLGPIVVSANLRTFFAGLDPTIFMNPEGLWIIPGASILLRL